ncbi:MAG: PKD domain-containing protein [Candidatus Paceibacterota bacterium]
MKSDLSYFIILIGLTLGLLIQGPSLVLANSGDVTGWAWMGADCTNSDCSNTTKPLGWISFSSENEGASGDYGVFADYDVSAANTLQGAAWIGSGDSNENVGWLSFDDNGVPSWEDDSSNFAQVDADTNEITGWAPIKSKDGSGSQSIVTWVKFKGSGSNYEYSSEIEPEGSMATGSTNHYAWSGSPSGGELGGTVVGEAGLRGSMNGPEWNSVSFSEDYDSAPSVFVTTQTTNGGQDPSAAHSRNVSTNGFDTQHCEFDGGDSCDGHNAEENGWIAIKESKINNISGMKAGSVQAGGGHTTISFDSSFSNDPYVFAQVQTENDGGNPRNVQVQNVSTNGFTLEFCDQDGTDGCEGHGNETVSWWAIDPTVADKKGMFDWGTVGVDDSAWESVSFSTAFGSKPAVIAMSQTENGGQEALYPEVDNVDVDGASVRYCESEADNSCDTHAHEKVAWVAVESGSMMISDFLVEDSGLGWIDLNPGLYDSVDDEKGVKFPPPNSKPEVSFDSSEFSTLDFDTLSQNYCETDATGRVDLKWAYSDADGDDEDKYRLRVYDSSGVLTATATETSLLSGEPKVNGRTFLVTTDSDSDLNFNETYTWEVKVYDDKGRESDWKVASGYSFSTPSHPLPHPAFEVIPKTPEIDSQVTFEDHSQCYDSPTGSGHDCDEDDNVSYFWDFGDGSTSDRVGTATHTYDTVDDYDVSLEVTDELGTCTETKTITATLPLPEWEEISTQ